MIEAHKVLLASGSSSFYNLLVSGDDVPCLEMSKNAFKAPEAPKQKDENTHEKKNDDIECMAILLCQSN